MFVTQLECAQAPVLKERLLGKGFVFKTVAYAFFQAVGEGIVLTFYLSGKLVIQGKGTDEFVRFFLEPEFLFLQTQSSPFHLQPHIGSDESGKGDFVGPLCVTALYANTDDLNKLKMMGVRDSKLLGDKAIRQLAVQLRKEFIHYSLVLKPEKYNTLYESFKNLNKMLAWAHCTAIRHLIEKTGCRHILIDQFAQEHVMRIAFGTQYADLHVVQQTKAESDLAVAAASIIARECFVEGLEELSQRTGIALKKGGGASATQSVKLFIQRYGTKHLKHVVKMHFKNSQQLGVHD